MIILKSCSLFLFVNWRERERGHSKPFKYKRYLTLLSLPTPKCSIIIKMNYTGKIMVQKVSNDVRIIA